MQLGVSVVMCQVPGCWCGRFYAETVMCTILFVWWIWLFSDKNEMKSCFRCTVKGILTRGQPGLIGWILLLFCYAPGAGSIALLKIMMLKKYHIYHCVRYNIYIVSFKAKGSNCVYKWLVDRSFCLEADDIRLRNTNILRSNYPAGKWQDIQQTFKQSCLNNYSKSLRDDSTSARLSNPYLCPL